MDQQLTPEQRRALALARARQRRAEAERQASAAQQQEASPQPALQEDSGNFFAQERPEGVGLYRDDRGQLRFRYNRDPGEDAPVEERLRSAAGGSGHILRPVAGGLTGALGGLVQTADLVQRNSPGGFLRDAARTLGEEAAMRLRGEAPEEGGIRGLASRFQEVRERDNALNAIDRNIPRVDQENAVEEVGQAVVQYGAGALGGAGALRQAGAFAGPIASRLGDVGVRFSRNVAGAGLGDFAVSDAAEGDQSTGFIEDRLVEPGEDATPFQRKLATGLEGAAFAGMGQPVGAAFRGAFNFGRNTLGALFRGAGERTRIMLSELMENNPEAARAIAALSQREAGRINEALGQSEAGRRTLEGLTAADYLPDILANRADGISNIENLARMLPEEGFGDIAARRAFAEEHFDAIANGLQGLRSLERRSLSGDFASSSLPRQVEASGRGLQEVGEQSLRGVENPVPLASEAGPELAERAAREIAERRAAELSQEAADLATQGQRAVDDAAQNTARTAANVVPGRQQESATEAVSRILTGDMSSPNLVDQGIVGRIRNTQRALYENAASLAANIRVGGAGVGARIRRAFPEGKDLSPFDVRPSERLGREDRNLLEIFRDIAERADEGRANWGEIVRLRAIVSDVAPRLDAGSRRVLSNLYSDLHGMASAALRDQSRPAADALDTALRFTRNEVAALGRLGSGGARLLDTVRKTGEAPMPEDLAALFVNSSGNLNSSRLRSMGEVIRLTGETAGGRAAQDLKGAFVDVITENLRNSTLRSSDALGTAFNASAVQNFLRQNAAALRRAGIYDEVGQRARQMIDAGQQSRAAQRASREMDRASAQASRDAAQAQRGQLDAVMEPTQPIAGQGSRRGVEELASTGIDQLRQARDQIAAQGGEAALQSLRRTGSEMLIDAATKGSREAGDQGAARITGKGLSHVFGDPASAQTRAVLDVMFEGDQAMRDSASEVMRILNRRAARSIAELPVGVKQAAEDGANRALIMLSSVYGITAGRGIMQISKGIRDAVVFGGFGGAKRAVAEAIGEMFSSRENLETMLQAVRGNKAAQDRLRPIIENIARANLPNNVVAALIGGEG